MTKKGKHMHFRTVKETRKLRGFSDLFMVNRRLIIIIIIIICFYFGGGGGSYKKGCKVLNKVC